MAKYFIFDNVSKGLAAIANTDEKKNSFLHLQNIYTAVQASDEDYLNVKKGSKKALLSNDNNALVQDFTEEHNCFDISTLEEAKQKINTFIENEIHQWKQRDNSIADSMINTLSQLDVDSLATVPSGTVEQWIFSQPGVTLERPFEL